MTLHSIWAILARWRRIIIPGVVIGLVGAAAAFFFTPYTYTLTNSYLLFSPVRDAEGAAGNPLLQLGNGVSLTADVLAVSLMDGETVRKYTDNAPDLTYTVSRDTAVTAPLILISVESPDLDTVRSTLGALETEVTGRLAALQTSAGAPRSRWITMTALTEDPKPQLGFALPIRNAIVAFLVLELLTLGSVALAERHRIRIRRAFEDDSVEVAQRQARPADRIQVARAMGDVPRGRGGAGR